MSLSLTNPSLSLAIRNNILGSLGLPGSSSFEMRQLWGLGEQGVWYEPYDPNTLHQRRNLLTFTEQFDVASWTKVGSTVTANAYSDRWDKIVEDTSTGAHYTQSANVNIFASSVYTVQVKWKAAERDKVRVLLSNAALWGGVNPSMSIDLSAGTFTLASGATNGSLTSLGSGEYLVSFTATATADGTSGVRLELRDAAGSVSYTGVATNGAFATDAQLERSSSPSSYQRVTDWDTEYAVVADGLTTMYRDSLGALPVTSVEQAVGLVLDKRLSLIRGPELRDTGVVGLVGTSAPATYDTTTGTGSVTRGVDANNQGYIQFTGLNSAATYEVLVTVTSSTGIFVRSGTFAGALGPAMTTGPRRSIIIAPVSGTITVTTETNPGQSTFTGLSIREVPGNHASQSTAAARPVLSARKNLLINTASSLIGVTGWGATNITGVLQGDGSSLISRTSTVANAFGAATISGQVIGATHSFQIKAKKSTIGNLFGLRIQGTYPDRVDAVFNLDTGVVEFSASGGAWTGVSATSVLQSDGFWLLTVRGTSVTTALSQIVFGPTNLATGGWEGPTTVLCNAYAKEPQVEYGPTATRYQRVNTATDYDSTGFPHYLKFDGVDDFLVTNSINFTATDKMTVWTGVTKLSDAAVGALVELSANPNANNGAFRLTTGNPANTYEFTSRGTLGPNASLSTATFIPPVSNVVTGIADIAGDLVRLRVNSVSMTANTADQGTGTFGNYPIYIGRRGGTTFPFNGQLNSLAIRGAASTDNQIKEAERYVASKTGVVLP